MRTLESRLAQVDRFGLMGEMTAGIAHEINQPLSAIATYAQAGRRVLSREPVNHAMVADICAKIDEQARRAGQVIQNLRDFIRRLPPLGWLSVDLPFTERDELALGRRDDELLVRVGPYRRSILLPDSLRRRAVVDAALRDGTLRVTFARS